MTTKLNSPRTLSLISFTGKATLISLMVMSGALFAPTITNAQGPGGPIDPNVPIDTSLNFQPVTATFSASSNSISSGSSVTLSWSSQNAGFGCTGQGFFTGLGANDFNDLVNRYPNVTQAEWDALDQKIQESADGSVTVSPTQTSSYTLTCSGIGDPSTVVDTEAVTVTAVNPPVASLSAAPTSITSGGTSVLTWSSTSATSCTGTGFVTNGLTNGTVLVSPTTSTTYSLSCVGAGGTGSDTEQVTVGPVVPTTFSNILQIDNNADHTTVVTTLTGTSAHLAPSAVSTLNNSYTFPTAGTWYVRSCADTNTSWVGTVTESNEGNNCSPWQSVTVVANTGLQPDLTAGSVALSSAEANTPVTLSSVISNTGAGHVLGVANFTNLFQIDDNADHTTVPTTRTATALPLAPAGYETVNSSHTFPSEGRWYVRSCADNNASWVGTVAEANEGNNCGEWTEFVIGDELVTQCGDGVDNDGDGKIDALDAGCDDGDGDEGGDVSVNFTASPTSVRSGESAMLTWSSNASTCTSGSFNTGGASDNLSGVSTGPLTQPVNDYEITCDGVTDFAQVTVNLPVLNITATPALVDGKVAGGSPTTLSWSASEVSTCDIESSQGGPLLLNDGVPAPNGGTTDVPVTGITRQTRFTLTCIPLVGSPVSSSVLVNVIPTLDEF